MNKLKEKFIQLGYAVVIENELGISMVKEDISTCLLILQDYDEKHFYLDSELRKPMSSKFSFADKGTFCIFINPGELYKIEELEADEYNAIKIHESHVDCVPHRKEDILITFKPIESVEDILAPDSPGYTINPLKKIDGIGSQDFFRYLSTAKDGDVVMYPRIISGMMLSWFRYVAQKQYIIKLEN